MSRGRDQPLSAETKVAHQETAREGTQGGIGKSVTRGADKLLVVTARRNLRSIVKRGEVGHRWQLLDTHESLIGLCLVLLQSVSMEAQVGIVNEKFFNRYSVAICLFTLNCRKCSRS